MKYIELYGNEEESDYWNPFLSEFSSERRDLSTAPTADGEGFHPKQIETVNELKDYETQPW